MPEFRAAVSLKMLEAVRLKGEGFRPGAWKIKNYFR
jgi:hypothetical protein